MRTATEGRLGRWPGCEQADDSFVGPGGCSMASADPADAVSVATTGPFVSVDVHYLRQPGGGCVEVRFDDKTVRRISTRGPWPGPASAASRRSPASSA
ncbi:MAG: hypothetical protein R3F43_15820 [bacterium]